MERFIKGDIVVVYFPFSDLSQTKKRPALVVSQVETEDLILCQITSKNVKDSYSIPISNNDIEQGSLKQESHVRPNKIFTADRNIISYKIGNLKSEKLQQITNSIINIIQN